MRLDRSIPSYRSLAFVLLVALVLRVAAVVLFGNGEDIDNYDNIARSLLKGQGYRAAQDSEPNVQRPPAYPVFLFLIYSALGPSPKHALLCQAVLSCMTIMVVFYAARRVFDRRVALIGSALFAAYPFSIWYATLLLSETLFTFLLAMSVFYWVRLYQGGTYADACGSGFWIGLSALCRSAALLLPVAVGMSLLVGKRCRGRQTAIHMLLVVATSVAVVVPWTLRNAYVAKAILPVSIGMGHAFYEGNVLGLKPAPEGNIFRRDVCPEREKERMRLFRELSRMGGRQAVEEDRRLWALGVAWAKEHPDLFFLGILRKGIAYWYVNSWPTETKTALIVSIQTPLLALAVIGCWRKRKSLRSCLPLLFLIGYFWLVHSILIVWIRLSFPSMPFVLVLAAAGLLKDSGRMPFIVSYGDDERH